MKSQKSLRALAKRVKFSATGKVMCRRAGKSHNLTSKSQKRKRFLNHQAAASKPIERKVKRLLPFS
jgi:large subunit ribosomal protein L35